MQDKLVKQADNIINKKEFEESTKELIGLIPSIAKLTMGTYKGFLNEGFNEAQAFDFAKTYVLKMLMPNK